MRKHGQFLELQQASALSGRPTYVTQDLGQMKNPYMSPLNFVQIKVSLVMSRNKLADTHFCFAG